VKQGQLVDVLSRAQAVLVDPDQWTKCALARNVLRRAVLPLSETALSWSLTGAMAVGVFEVLGPNAAQIDWQRLYDGATEALWQALPSDHPRTPRKTIDLDGFNDFPGTHHSDVMAVFCRAIDAVQNEALLP
jgi:hypothetical protein